MRVRLRKEMAVAPASRGLHRQRTGEATPKIWYLLAQIVTRAIRFRSSDAGGHQLMPATSMIRATWPLAPAGEC